MDDACSIGADDTPNLVAYGCDFASLSFVNSTRVLFVLFFGAECPPCLA